MSLQHHCSSVETVCLKKKLDFWTSFCRIMKEILIEDGKHLQGSDAFSLVADSCDAFAVLAHVLWLINRCGAEGGGGDHRTPLNAF